jgi:DNA-binding NtrC family response regulator
MPNFAAGEQTARLQDSKPDAPPAARLDAARNAVPALARIVGSSPPMQKVFRDIERLAPYDESVLILGETGTGKELVARAIHAMSPRRQAPFIPINCGALQETLAHAELFGHEPGAFTGALGRHIGKLEQAHGGTLFLDELAEMRPSLQPELLRFLDEPRIQRLGGDQFIPTDVRIIAATNKDLEERVRSGAFREDLYYRLKVSVIRLPPLRDRPGDVAELIDEFATTFSWKYRKFVALTIETWRLLQRYHWPGNVRELQNVLHDAILRSTGEVLGPECLQLGASSLPAGPLHSLDGHAPPAPAPEPLPPPDPLRAVLASFYAAGHNDLYRRFEFKLLHTVLGLAGGNKTVAAQRLGISRNTLKSKLKAHNLEP